MLGATPKQKTFDLPGLNPVVIKGHSRSAKRTGYIVMPYNIVLDAGYAFEKPSNLTLVSHGHHDHIAALYQILKETDNRYVMIPKTIEQDVYEFLNSSFRLDGGLNIFKWSPITIPEYITKINGKKIKISTYNLDHRVETIGFGINEIQEKIKPEFSNLDPKEIKILIQQKIDFKYSVFVPIVLFVSDTSRNALTHLPFSDYRLVIIECTFFHKDDYINAQKKKHIHWNDLEEFVKRNPDTHFILGHFSAKYKNEYLIEMESNIKKMYSNITFWI